MNCFSQCPDQTIQWGWKVLFLREIVQILIPAMAGDNPLRIGKLIGDKFENQWCSNYWWRFNIFQKDLLMTFQLICLLILIKLFCYEILWNSRIEKILKLKILTMTLSVNTWKKKDFLQNNDHYISIERWFDTDQFLLLSLSRKTKRK